MIWLPSDNGAEYACVVSGARSVNCPAGTEESPWRYLAAKDIKEEIPRAGYASAYHYDLWIEYVYE